MQFICLKFDLEISKKVEPFVYQPLIHWRKSRNEVRSLSLIRGLSFLRLLTTKMMGVGLGHYPMLQPDHLR